MSSSNQFSFPGDAQTNSRRTGGERDGRSEGNIYRRSNGFFFVEAEREHVLLIRRVGSVWDRRREGTLVMTDSREVSSDDLWPSNSQVFPQFTVPSSPIGRAAHWLSANVEIQL